MLPAASFSGKSALVAALVQRGATYYSDEYAVLDADGRIHPYPRPLSLRAEGERYGTPQPVEALGGRAADRPAEAAVVAVTRYVPGARYEPVRRDPGAAALAMLAHAVPARSRPQEAMHAIARAADGCQVLEGDRGDAAEAADVLLDALRA
jgi:hypothetical protein